MIALAISIILEPLRCFNVEIISSNLETTSGRSFIHFTIMSLSGILNPYNIPYKKSSSSVGFI